ncbi:MAG: hypothetical protein EPN86_00670 [Nanoarchaeota archaeon]|nr:MAG: hypothetical protein EPN86_00670 [Nanoarchaeota archaeon]
MTGGILIGETTITSIPAFGSSQASITYTIPTASSKTIFIKIDPLNSVFAGFVIENMTRNVVKILQENSIFYDRFLFSFMVKHSMTCSRCSHGDNVMYYGWF